MLSALSPPVEIPTIHVETDREHRRMTLNEPESEEERPAGHLAFYACCEIADQAYLCGQSIRRSKDYLQGVIWVTRASAERGYSEDMELHL